MKFGDPGDLPTLNPAFPSGVPEMAGEIPIGKKKLKFLWKDKKVRSEFV